MKRSPNSKTIGRSCQGRVIELFEFGAGPRRRLILAGVHGDEPKAVSVARRLCDELAGGAALPPDTTIGIVPVVNPDGYEIRRRRNAQGVDLNRNLPTEDWEPGRRRSRNYGGPVPASEPETQAVVGLIESWRPTEIISVHSISGHRQCNNFDGPGRPLAEALAGYNGYPVTETIGYPTPGSLGSWAGRRLGIPTVTLELPSHHSPKRCWVDNCDALLAVL